MSGRRDFLKKLALTGAVLGAAKASERLVRANTELAIPPEHEPVVVATPKELADELKTEKYKHAYSLDEYQPNPKMYNLRFNADGHLVQIKEGETFLYTNGNSMQDAKVTIEFQGMKFEGLLEYWTVTHEIEGAQRFSLSGRGHPTYIQGL